MLTLSDINTLTNSKDGDIYSDLYKDVYGSRPRYAKFESIEEFDEDYEFLVKRLNEKMEQEREEQIVNFAYFETHVEEVQEIMNNCTRERAIEAIAEANGIDEEEFKFYGLESLEYKFGLKFGSIAQWLSE